MIYEWRCKNCEHRVEISRAIEDRHIPPTADEGRHPSEDGLVHDVVWTRIFSSSTPFKVLADRGVFMDEHGNYPPRKID